MEKKISKATMSRFPVYLKALRKMQHEGKENMFYRVNCLKLQEYKIQQLGVILHIYQKRIIW